MKQEREANELAASLLMSLLLIEEKFKSLVELDLRYDSLTCIIADYFGVSIPAAMVRLYKAGLIGSGY